MAVNTVIQGSAADLIKIAMIRIHRRLQESTLQAKMLLQIHDELMFEVATADAPELADLVRHEMKSAIELDVPLKVDVKLGKNWSSCEPQSPT
jgi:DNA polymerase-1